MQQPLDAWASLLSRDRGQAVRGRVLERTSQEPVQHGLVYFILFFISGEREVTTMETDFFFFFSETPNTPREPRESKQGPGHLHPRQDGSRPVRTVSRQRGGTSSGVASAEAPSFPIKARGRGRQCRFSQTGSDFGNCPQGPARRRGRPAEGRAALEQYMILQRPGHPVDDEPPVITQGGEEPGVSRGPVHGIHAVLVLLVCRDDAVLRGLLAPTRYQRHA